MEHVTTLGKSCDRVIMGEKIGLSRITFFVCFEVNDGNTSAICVGPITRAAL